MELIQGAGATTAADIGGRHRLTFGLGGFGVGNGSGAGVGSGGAGGTANLASSSAVRAWLRSSAVTSGPSTERV